MFSDDREAADLETALAEARSGSEWAVALLFRAFNPPLQRYLRHHAPYAAARLPRIDGGVDDFRAWLFTVARRRVADHYRRKSRSARLVTLEAAPDTADEPDLATRVTTDLAAEEAVELLVRKLPRHEAEVVLLRVLGDLSVEQTARIMGRSAGSVRVLQHRAMRRMAKIAPQVVTR
jgi:RNA polymerase sigma-70 factor (ECF subfamily)